jgi:hypothetical protein
VLRESKERIMSFCTICLVSLNKYMGRPRIEELMPRYRPVSKASSTAVLPHKQVSLVRLVESIIPGGGFLGLRQKGERVGATIVEVLKAEPRDKRFLYNAQEKDSKFTTYGELSDFILGAGNLSNILVHHRGTNCSDACSNMLQVK